MSQNARGGAPPNRISSEEVFVSCAGHPSHVETGEGRGEEDNGKEKGKGLYILPRASTATAYSKTEIHCVRDSWKIGGKCNCRTNPPFSFYIQMHP